MSAPVCTCAIRSGFDGWAHDDDCPCKPRRASEDLLRRGIEDAIHALTHLMKQSGKPDQGEIVSRVVSVVVPRLHEVLAGDDPYGD